MKKLLSILGSLTLAASASSAVIACSSETHVLTPDDYMNNNYNNIMAASLEKAKQVIVNNEHGISQSYVSDQQKFLKVKDQGLKGINYKQIGGENAKVSDLINKYYSGNSVEDDTNTGIDLGGNDGVTNTFNALIDKLLGMFPGLNNPVVRSILVNGKDTILQAMSTLVDTVNANKLSTLNTMMYNQALSGQEFTINTAIKMGINYISGQLKNGGSGAKLWNTLAGAIVWILNSKDKLANDTIPGFFSSKDVKVVKEVASQLLNTNGNATSPLQDAVYKNTDIKLHDFTGDTATISLVDDYLKKFDTTDTPDFSTKDTIESVNFKDVKAELFSSIYRIAITVLNPEAVKLLAPNVTSKTLLAADDRTKAGPYPYQGFINKFEDLITNVVTGFIDKKTDGKNMLDDKGNPLKGTDGKEITFLNPAIGSEANIMGLVWEGLRDIVLINAQFSVYEQTKFNNPIDSQHLFGSKYDGEDLKDSTNYGFINSLVDRKLSDCDFLKIKDEPININYFFSNLDYFIGNISDGNDDVIYRIQKFLFILFNDPTHSGRKDGTTTPKTWIDKQSDLLDLITNSAVKIATRIVDEKAAAEIKDKKPGDTKKGTFEIISEILKTLSKSDINVLENKLLKPIILGIINGDSLQNILNAASSFIRTGYLAIPALKQMMDMLPAIGIKIQDLFDAIEDAVGKDKIGDDTIHKLFTGDYRNITDRFSKVIPQEWMDKLFGTNKVNLTTLFTLPINNILTILGIPGFKGGLIAPYADYFTTQSIPEIVNFLDGFLNGINEGIPDKYLVYKSDGITPDYTKSLKARDINLGALYDFFVSITGTSDDGKDNIVTKILNDLVETSTNGATDANGNITDFSKIKIKLDPLKFVSDLGITGQKEKTNTDWGTSDKKTLVEDTPEVPSTDSSTMTGVYDADAKTVTFTAPKGIEIPDAPIKFGPDDSADETNAFFKFKNKEEKITGVLRTDANTIVVQLSDPIVQINTDQIIAVEYDSPLNKEDPTKQFMLSGTFKVPALFADGTDLTISKQSIVGGFYRLFVPEIDQLNSGAYESSGANQFTMHDKYLETDLLNSDYRDFVNLLNWLNEPGKYESLVQQILINEKAFNYQIDPKSIRYFRSDTLLIKGFEFSVTYRNYISGETNEYNFTVQRNSNIEGFNILKITTDRRIEN